MADSSEPQSFKPLRLLILEDDLGDVELMVTVLKQAGYSLTFEVAASCEQFRQQLEKDNFDIILADYNLGTWNAMDALRILLKLRKDIPLVIVTGSLGDEAAAACIKQGAADYVLKNHLHRLPIVVGCVLNGKAQETATRLAAARLAQGVIHDFNNLLAVIAGPDEKTNEG